MRSRKLFSRLSMAVLVLVVLAVALTAGGRDRGQFMFVDELQPGMAGYCKTALNGNQITSFNFTIVDILRYVGIFRSTQEYKVTILARAEEGFWIAGGMSGSPCYINDKLIGALFAGWRWSTAHTEPGEPFLIQPIEEMLPVLDACLQKTAAPLSVGATTGLLGHLPAEDQAIMATSLTGATDVSQIRVVTAPPSPEEMEVLPQTLFVHYLSTPVTVTGLSERAFAWLQDGMEADVKRSALRYLRGGETFNSFVNSLSQGLEERYDVQLYNMGGGGQLQVDPGPLEPGAPVGSAVMLGDASWGSYGTVTYVEDQCLIAYGHPDWLLGDTDLFMTSAYIADIIRSLQRPFKEGFLVEELGSVVEDRLTAIAGAIGRPTKALQFDIKVTDKDSGITNEFRSKSVALPDLILGYPDNLLLAGVGAVDVALDRIGPGTMNMHLTIKGPGGQSLLERSDIYVSNYDIAAEGTFDPGWIAFMLAWNEFADPKISEIDLDLSVEKALRVKVIERVEPGQQSISAGSRLRYTVTLQTYRGPRETISGYITIPQYAAGDYIALEAFPARDFFWKYEMYGSWVRPYWMEQVTSLNDLIKAIEDVPTNDLLVVTAYSLTQGGRSAVYAYDLKPLGDWYADGDRTSEGYVQVK